MSRLLVLGAGVSGLAAARLARSKGMSVTIFDESAPVPAMEEGFGVATGTWDPSILQGVDLVVTSPGFSERSLPVVETLESGIPIWSEIEFAWRQTDRPVVAVTGTNGKTTVTEVTSAMLGASGIDAPAAGNIGSPMSDFAEANWDVLVVEVSSFQLRFVEEFHPQAAAITNVALDHLDWHRSEQAYRDAKSRIFMNQTQDDLLVYDHDDDGATSLALLAPSEKYPVSGLQRPPAGGGPEDGLLVVRDVEIGLASLPSMDPSHLSNLAAAMALALRMGASSSGVTSTACHYRPGAHRRSLVHRENDISWVDDSKATNPHAALASIRAHGPVILIAGGMAKGLDVTPLAEEPNVEVLLGIGETAELLSEAAGDRGRVAGSLEEAVELAAQLAKPGDTVLLAPGCASFDQFASYEARGDRFAELVEATIGGDGK